MIQKNIFVNQIKAGDQITECFLVTEKNMTFSQKGAPYLSLRLKDKTGEIEGRVWDRVADLEQLFKKGDFIRIQSRAASFKNALQLSIVNLRKIEDKDIDPADFTIASKSDIQEMFLELLIIIDEVKNSFLKELLQSFFNDQDTAERFKKAPAAKGFHHVCRGGLLEHTLSVARLLSVAADHYKDVDRDLLIAGGILHDIGKIDELSYDKIIEYSDEGRLIGHIVMGLEMIDKKTALIADFPKPLAMKLRHIILSHHGEMEFGSPKRPKTIEALIIHHIDDLDAKVNAFQSHMENNEDKDSDWTPFHKLLERYLYKK
jgi:3'-5' exoribonuclease